MIYFFFFWEIISFEDEPGKQVRSAVRIKNTSKSNVAFKVMKFRFLLMFMFLWFLPVMDYRHLDYALKLGECHRHSRSLYKTISHNSIF